MIALGDLNQKIKRRLLIKISSMLRTVTPRFAASKLNFPNVNHQPRPYNGPAYEQIVKDRKTWMPNFYFHYYQKPLLIVEGHMQYLYDHTGKRYVDLISGISTVSCGHAHPSINKVAMEQFNKVAHTSPIYFSEVQGEYSKKLCESLGNGFDSVYLCNSGGQANDFAIYLARLYTNQYKFFSLKNAYHGLVGNSANVTGVTTWNGNMRGGFEFEKFGWPSAYRGVNNTKDSLLNEAKETLNSSAYFGGKLAGWIFEPMQGVGGINVYPEGYIPQMTKLIQSHGGLVICDQVQTGFGRVGNDWWGFKWQGIKPDIVTMAKGIGNGFPMGAVVTRKEIMNSINQIYFNTFGGGHVQCRVGMEVLRVIKEQKLAENADKVGSFLISEFKKLQDRYETIGDVRGKGLMIAIEMVKDRKGHEPNKQLANKLMEATRERGCLFGKTGIYGNVFRMQPPLCLSMEDAKYVVDVFEDSMNSIK